MRNITFFLVAAAIGAAVFIAARLIGNDYLFFAGYTVLQSSFWRPPGTFSAAMRAT